MRNNHANEREVVWFVCGSLIGASLALLLAPQSGKRTRRDIQRFGRTVWKRADRFTEDIQQSLHDLMDEVGDVSKAAASAGRDMTEKTRDEVLGILDTGRKFLDDEKKRWEKVLRG